jgi:hypothetical protein
VLHTWQLESAAYGLNCTVDRFVSGCEVQQLNVVGYSNSPFLRDQLASTAGFAVAQMCTGLPSRHSICLRFCNRLLHCSASSL